ncbi:MAG: ABC transporter substrate-binding protein [Pseudomonadota bacterium]
MIRYILSPVLWCALWLAPLLQADVKVIEQAFEDGPYKVIQDTTAKVLQAIDEGPDPVKEPEKFVEQLSLILDSVVAFDYIAKGVMGTYAKQASKEQVKQFASAFKLGLVNTYGKGMANFSDFEVKVLVPEEPIGDKKRVSVVQQIKGSASTNQVSYLMGKNKKGEWKMINVVLNGVNLGQTFRGQFAAAVEKNKGDLAKTISEWSTI